MFVEVLSHFHDFEPVRVVCGYEERVAKQRKLFLEKDVHDGTGYPAYYTFFHCLAPLRFMDFAPEVTSVISWVIAA